MQVKFQDIVQIDPWDFRKPSEHALEDNINAKYANKVIQRIGLCICLWDVLKASEGLISQGTGEGRINVNTEFRLVIFRPFKGEICQGKLIYQDTSGIRVGLDFFNDIWIPRENLFPGSEFSPDENVWIWTAEDGNQFFYDNKETVRFRVEDEVWFDHTPQKPRSKADLEMVKKEVGGGGATENGDAEGDLRAKEVPYTIIVSSCDVLLGVQQAHGMEIVGIDGARRTWCALLVGR